ncbi:MULTISPECIES: archaemetzincin family Zn-dependent metalloprotease [Anaeromyxobacter]|uniref:archaemetzincin family Zn-dependent metalloprotease n=1 Tax=Anaeromyxobacter TaxID=161492 RepID=UPI001F59DBC2|nr:MULTISPECIES: archaemetzincin family Zn-dependent metalloprotease [unclassified Anaeromyxobacter]
MLSIFVWWIGEGEVDRELMEHVRVHLAAAFGRPVFLWESPERPRHAYDEKRKQHRTTPILSWLGESGPGSGKVLGITDGDLFIPILTYVFGEAQLGGGAAVVSLKRLVEPGPGGRALLALRLAKEAVHEVGHAFGLVHCGHERCVMSRSPAVREVDAKGVDLCPECRSHLDDVSEGA